MPSRHMVPNWSLPYANRLFSIPCHWCFVKFVRCIVESQSGEAKTTLDDKGNIVVDQFSFLVDNWSQIVPRTVRLMNHAISHLADGIWWEPIVDILAPVKVRVDCDSCDLYVADVTPLWKQTSDSHLLEHFDQLVALLKMAFHGFGGGSARLNELSDPTMFHCIYTNGTVYYTFASKKGFNTASRRSCKEIQRKLPPIIARYFLLYRSFIQTRTSSSSTEIPNDNQQNLIFPSRNDRSDIGPQHIIRDLFSLSAPPNMTQVRHFWAGVSNFITGGEAQPNHFLSSNSMAASKMGHSSLTHAITYSSQQVGAEESHFNAYHFAIGDTSHHMLQSKEHISLVDLRNAIQLRHPMSTSLSKKILSPITYRFSRRSWLSSRTLPTFATSQNTVLLFLHLLRANRNRI